MRPHLSTTATARLIVLIAVLAAFPDNDPTAATYFVDGANPSCSNVGPGTAAVPYCTISAASAARGGPGVTLMVMPAVSVPGDLTVTRVGGVSQISWTSIPGATAYDVVLGTLSVLQSTQGDFHVSTGGCVANDTAATSVQHPPDPAAGDGYFYLVRPLNCGGNGAYESFNPSQVGLRDPEVAASPLRCP
ncbi:MAG: hypothetical protein ACREAA_06755 [Candidatus Polarisedimenticolia bacterium]